MSTSGSHIYSAGLRNVGSYQVAGIPYLTASNLSGSEKLFEFPYVTKNILVENTGSNDLHLYFSASSVNKLVLPPSKTLNMDVKCAFIYASASTATGMQMAAELTNISTGNMYSLDGLEGV